MISKLHFSRFAINLMLGDDIAFHFNPRFNMDCTCVVRNTRIDGTWGHEERYGIGMPFTPGEMFEVKITVESDHYKASILFFSYHNYEQCSANSIVNSNHSIFLT